MRSYITLILYGITIVFQAKATDVQIEKVQGDVKVRRGMDENWIQARAGMELEAMDTILSGEASEIVLILEDGVRFRMGGNAILDIGDLRRITQRQLFLYLMSQKVGNLSMPESSPKIHITNVSVIRGTQKQSEDEKEISAENMNGIRETNGAKALFSAEYYTNAIMKFYKILERYPSIQDEGEIHFYLGQAFEALEENGRAHDAYQTALEQLDNSKSSQAIERKLQIQEALNRLKSDSAF